MMITLASAHQTPGGAMRENGELQCHQVSAVAEEEPQEEPQETDRLCTDRCRESGGDDRGEDGAFTSPQVLFNNNIHHSDVEEGKEGGSVIIHLSGSARDDQDKDDEAQEEPKKKPGKLSKCWTYYKLVFVSLSLILAIFDLGADWYAVKDFFKYDKDGKRTIALTFFISCSTVLFLLEVYNGVLSIRVYGFKKGDRDKVELWREFLSFGLLILEDLPVTVIMVTVFSRGDCALYDRMFVQSKVARLALGAAFVSSIWKGVLSLKYCLQVVCKENYTPWEKKKKDIKKKNAGNMPRGLSQPVITVQPTTPIPPRRSLPENRSEFMSRSPDSSPSSTRSQLATPRGSVSQEGAIQLQLTPRSPSRSPRGSRSNIFTLGGKPISQEQIRQLNNSLLLAARPEHVILLGPPSPRTSPSPHGSPHSSVTLAIPAGLRHNMHRGSAPQLHVARGSITNLGTTPRGSRSSLATCNGTRSNHATPRGSRSSPAASLGSRSNLHSTHGSRSNMSTPQGCRSRPRPKRQASMSWEDRIFCCTCVRCRPLRIIINTLVCLFTAYVFLTFMKKDIQGRRPDCYPSAPSPLNTDYGLYSSTTDATTADWWG